MTALLTADDLRNVYAIDTDADDDALTTILTSEQSEIERLSGTPASITEYFYPGSFEDLILLSQDAASITSVREYQYTDTLADRVENQDYRFENRRVLRRLFYSDESDLTDMDAYAYRFWKAPVQVTYVPAYAEGLAARQKITLVQLVKLWLAFSGYKSIGGPEIRVEALDYRSARDEILNAIAPNWTFV